MALAGLEGVPDLAQTVGATPNSHEVPATTGIPKRTPGTSRRLGLVDMDQNVGYG